MFKLRASDEYANQGIRHSFEIKTLCLADPDKHGGKGYGSALLKQAIKHAKEKQLSSLHLTVSTTRNDALDFFLHKGFVKKSFLEKTQEHLLSLTIQVTSDRYLTVINGEEQGNPGAWASEIYIDN